VRAEVENLPVGGVIVWNDALGQWEKHLDRSRWFISLTQSVKV